CDATAACAGEELAHAHPFARRLLIVPVGLGVPVELQADASVFVAIRPTDMNLDSPRRRFIDHRRGLRAVNARLRRLPRGSVLRLFCALAFPASYELDLAMERFVFRQPLEADGQWKLAFHDAAKARRRHQVLAFEARGGMVKGEDAPRAEQTA